MDKLNQYLSILFRCKITTSACTYIPIEFKYNYDDDDDNDNDYDEDNNHIYIVPL